MNIYVGCLSYEVTEEDLQDAFKRTISAYAARMGSYWVARK